MSSPDQNETIQNHSQENHPKMGSGSVSAMKSQFRQKIQGQEYFTDLIEYTNQNNYNEIVNILNENPNIDIKKCRDSKGYNLIHKAILNNQQDLVIKYVNYAYNYEQKITKNQIIVKEQIKSWINEQTHEDKFTPLHLASFRGLIQVFNILEEYGADFDICNVKGTNVIHFAAQGDQPIALVYLKNRGINQNFKDDKQGTALHWACFLGHENSVNYLLSWQDTVLNSQDNDGLTPLHLATLMGYSRIVKKLLIRGAKRNIQDLHGKSPYDIAQEKRYTSIQNMIKTSPYSLQEYCNIKPAFKPTKYPRRQVYLFLLMFLIGAGCFVVIEFPFFQGNYIVCFYLTCVIVGLNLFFFLISWVKSPGVLKQKKKQNQENLLELLVKSEDPSKICPDCIIIKPERSRHCEICRCCVMVYDHHCPWINNCVGAKNHMYFFFFIVSMWINLAYFVVILVMNINKHYKENDWFPWFNEQKPSDIIINVFIIIDLVIAILFIFPLSFLIYVQINNLLMNKTTFERFNQHVQQNNQQQSEFTEVEQRQSSITQSLLTGQDTQIQNGDQSSIQHVYQGAKSMSNCFLICCQNEKNVSYRSVSMDQEELQEEE